MRKLDKVTNILICSILFLLPLATWSWAEDKAGLGVVLLLVIGAVCLSVLGIYKAVLSPESLSALPLSPKKVIIVTLVLSLTLIASYLLSDSRYLSLWGTSSGIGFTIIGWLAVIFFTASLTWHARSFKVETGLTVMLIAAAVKALVLVVLKLGDSSTLTAIGQFVDWEYFNTFVLLLTLLAIPFLRVAKRNTPILLTAVIINTIFLLLAGSNWVLLLVVAGAYIAFTFLAHSKPTLLEIIAFSALILVSFANSLNLLPLPKFSGLELPDEFTSITISLNTLAGSSKNLLVGAGLSTYQDIFPMFRPVSFNNTSSWTTAYTSPSSELHLLLSETGIILSCLILGVLIVPLLALWSPGRTVPESDKGKVKRLRNYFSPEDLPRFMSALIPVVAFLTLPLDIRTLGLLGILIVISPIAGTKGPKTKSPRDQIQFFDRTYLVVISLGILIAVSLFLPEFANYLRSEAEFAQFKTAQTSDNAQGAFDHMRNVVKILPEKLNYRLEFARLSLAMADVLISNGYSEVENLKPLYDIALEETNTATAVLAPNNLEAWLLRERTYLALATFTNTEDEVTQVIKQMINISPNHPLLRYKLGKHLFDTTNYAEAISALTDAIGLKNDYYEAYLLRARAYHQLGENDKATSDIFHITDTDLPVDNTYYQEAALLLKQIAQGSTSEDTQK